MIRFVCKQCGAKINRPDDAAGSVVFCACGRQNRVPWESTEAEPLVPEPEPAPAEAPLPILLEEEPEPPRRPERRPEPSRGWRPFKKPEAQRRDPDFCFNHQDRPKTTTCADCAESFCDACTVTVREQTLCGPCKNYRVRTLQKPRSPSALAIMSGVVGVISCPVVFCPTFSVAAVAQTGADVSTPLVSLGLGLVPVVALVLGVFGLWQVEAKPRVSGRAWAVLGMTSATAGLLWCLTLAWASSLRGAGQ
jgi:hypothetical protein